MIPGVSRTMGIQAGKVVDMVPSGQGGGRKGYRHDFGGDCYSLLVLALFKILVRGRGSSGTATSSEAIAATLRRDLLQGWRLPPSQLVSIWRDEGVSRVA